MDELKAATSFEEINISAAEYRTLLKAKEDLEIVKKVLLTEEFYVVDVLRVVLGLPEREEEDEL